MRPNLDNNTKYQGCAVLTAAGIGLRYATSGSTSSTSGTPGASSAKQFIDLSGKPLYRWSLERLCRSDCIDRIVIATRVELLRDIELQVQDLARTKPIHVIAGGATRQLSVYNGLEYLSSVMDPSSTSNSTTVALVHDAVRPFPTRALIKAVFRAATEHGAATAALQVSDTVKRVSGSVITKTLDRERLVLVQTPQAARLDWLIEAHRRAIKDGITTTDDAAILEKYGHKVHTVAGSPLNIKVTSAADMNLAGLLAQSPLANFD